MIKQKNKAKPLLHYQIENDFSSMGSFTSIPYDKKKLNISPLFSSKCKFVKGLSSHFGRKLSSLYVIDQELIEMPFFNFEEKRINSRKTKNIESNSERTHLFWEKITKSVLTPFLSNNRILIDKYLKIRKSINETNFKMSEDKNKFKAFTKNSQNPKNIITKLQNFGFVNNAKFFCKGSDNKAQRLSFEHQGNSSFGDLKENFRRKSCYNDIEGQMTKKQVKFYKLFINKKTEVLNSNSDIHEEPIEKKQIHLKKEHTLGKIPERKAQISLLGYLKSRSNDKKLDFLIKKTEDIHSNREITELEAPFSQKIIMKLSTPQDNQNLVKFDNIGEKSQEQIDSSLFKTKTRNKSILEINIRPSFKKNTFLKENDITNLFSPRLKISNRNLLLEKNNSLSIRKNVGKFEEDISRRESQEEDKKDMRFNNIIHNINKKKNNRGSFKEKREKIKNSNSLWTNRKDLDNLKNLRQTLEFSNEKKEKKEKKERKNNDLVKESYYVLEKFSDILKKKKENLKRMKKSLEKESRNLFHNEKIPSNLKSGVQIANDLYAIFPKISPNNI